MSYISSSLLSPILHLHEHLLRCLLIHHLFRNGSIGWRPRIRPRHTQLRRIPALTLQICAEALIFNLDGVLADGGNQREGDNGRQDAQAGRDPEGVLRGGDFIIAAGLLDVGKDPGADKGANLAHGGGDAVVAAADAGGAGLGGEQADVVAGADLAEGEEDAVHDGKGGDVFGDVGVDAGHDEADDGLDEDARGEGVFGADEVGEEGAEDGAGEVEEVDEGVPAKDGGEGRGGGIEGGEDGGGVDAKGVDGELDG